MSPQPVHPEAAAEFREAVDWYEERERGLGLRFIERARSTRKDMARWPSAAATFLIAEDGTVIRSKGIHGFPYRIIYAAHEQGIFILAFAHHRRRPGYWLRRVKDL
jgi:toxin ParE1/3/4